MSKLTFKTPYPVNLDTFFDHYTRNVQKVDKRVNEYVKNPTEENIHDLRTSIRRLDASYQSSPKQLQKKKIKKYVLASKRLFKLNSEIRDFDIILEKLYDEGQMPEQQLEPLKQSLVSEKSNKLVKALSVADKLRNLKVPSPTMVQSLHSRNNIQMKLTRKYNKIVANFAKRIDTNLPVVVDDCKKVEELHEIRKDCKKLRYMFELLLNDDDKKNGTIGREDLIVEKKNNYIHEILGLIGILEQIQDNLGVIHDYDITIAYLKEHGLYHHNGSENKIIGTRKNRYEQFVQYCKSDLLKNDSNLFISGLDSV
jgi:CHAD domain-containing protein